ncbi:MAG: S9 family peptidase, partial [Gemmatimonadetes bacterium]|nr:S9 family peptidase [Gemmatimonadota bacterium]NIQ58497.1 S9 family peptidase [Gemmatimonadota bacterium]NIX47523.1 S9 family peptidase [Gemmatimonadota bacterium]NIY11892.1 S9 family peptidase [Gemmatimonadota bacterium]
MDFEDAEARPITEGERLVGDFAVSPDGERVAFTFRTENHRNDGYRSEIALVDVAGGEIRRLTDNAAPESSLAWHPDGERLLFR